MDYESYFRNATAHAPYDWQRRVVGDGWPDIIDVPTGLGKTAGVAVAWLYGIEHARDVTPTRLVYCLPMRTLVEQTRDAIRGWIETLGQDIGVYVLMGGDTDDSWADHPERPAVLIGTQDMLLSRALNRGYGRSRYRWPVDFALLNNDALWIFDEIQLMGVGVETSAQLDGLRKKLSAARDCRSVWMSATVGRQQLATVDHPDDGEWRALTISDEDRRAAATRLDATKSIEQSPLTLGAKRDDQYAAHVAERVLERHQPGTTTLVILNRVQRAVDVYRALLASGRNADDTSLLHGRFRPAERESQRSRLSRQGEHVIVATQVVEAGIDLSATTLVTELAPWPSIVQRVGRCNRDGRRPGVVEWIDAVTDSEKDEGVLPYDIVELRNARDTLLTQTDGSPSALSAVPYEPSLVIRPVVRRRDVVQLFDTTADLTGADLDVSRWVRDQSDPDFSVFWRQIADEAPDPDIDRPHHRELCRVSMAATGFVEKAGGWFFDHIERRWAPLKGTRVRPGMTVLLDVGAGGYSDVLGFTGDKKDIPTAIPPNDGHSEPGFTDDNRTGNGNWLTVTQHLIDVADSARELGDALGLPGEWAARIELAARWHDVGKAHPEFQRRLLAPLESHPEKDGPDGEGPWGKSNHRFRAPEVDGRRYFRHELVSALMFLQQYAGADRDFVAYLIAAHHGKIRLGLRSMPTEETPPSRPAYFAMGVWHGDEMPEVDLGDGTVAGPATLDLSLMRMGEGSWRERTLALLDQHGPFALGWWEALVRVADWWGTDKGKEVHDG